MGDHMLYSTQNTLIVSAAQCGDISTLIDLKEKGLDKYLLDEALFCASLNGKSEFVKRCISFRADIDFWDSSEDETVLSVACREGHVDVVSILLEAGCDLNAQSKGQMHTAIHSCAVGGAVKCLTLLLECSETNKDKKDCLGNTALLRACHEGNSDIVKLLLAAGANHKTQNLRKNDAFSVSMDRGQALCVKELLLAIPDLANERGHKDGLYPLTRAIKNRQLPIIKAFIESGCDVNCPESSLLRPLHLAIEVGDVALVEALANGGADINTPLTVPIGSTPLMLAVAKGQPAIVQALAQAGCQLDAFDPLGRTALFLATKFGYPACMNILLENGSNPDAYQWTGGMGDPDEESVPSPPALHAAILYARQEEAVMLIQGGANLDFPAFYQENTVHRNNRLIKLNPMEVAERNGALWAMALLMEAGSICIAPVENLAERDEKLTNLLQKAKWLMHNPDSLKNQCRRFIRKTLSKYLPKNVHKLPLPGPLLEYVMFEHLSGY